MLPDGPERSDRSDRSDRSCTVDQGAHLPISPGCHLLVASSFFRERVGASSRQFHTWPDGTRERMKICIVNQTEVRGWVVKRGDEFVFQWPVSYHKHVTTHIDPEKGILFPCMPREDVQSLTNSLIKNFSSTIYFAKTVLKMNEVFANLVAFSNTMAIRLVDFDEEKSMLSLQYEDDCAPPRKYELPVSKLAFSFLDHECRLLSRMVSPLWCVVKAMIKFRRLHLQAESKKYAPSGIGFKRVHSGETALKMKRPCGAGIVPVSGV